MASELRADKAGFAREMQQKLTEKFDGAEAAKTLRWFHVLRAPNNLPERFTKAVEKIPRDIQNVDMEAYAGYLRDGLALGYLMACLDPSVASRLESVKTWQISDKTPFETSRQRDRIGLFLRFASELGVASTFQFQTDQLFESTNLSQVVVCLSQVGVEAQAKPGFSGPTDFWMHKHRENKREFSEEQLRAGEGIIGLQMGTTAGANASGVTFGGRRHITDTF
ncbi:hypothetical protein P879_04125 [Paragonimus westermani]|uniref:Calponin-homology (CH) domain-containing protein n=1 Tax=Paragonimus westermani TaxID=34504 RepID=A0A8T0DXE6_9TREM|nr:hypothetical protein P879_04125 [Paragonimus westermani]